MKNKQEIIQEIHQLAKNISETNSEEALIESAQELYEKSIVLKYTAKTEPVAIVKQEEHIISTKESVKPESSKKDIAPKEPAIDLFSSEPVPDAEPVSEKPVTKEPKAAKNKSDESVGEKLQHKKIIDLKASIGINEKFQFINELFEGNMKEYNVAIDQINNFTAHEDAENYLTDLKQMYKWKEENPIAINFLDLVQRRFL